MTKNTPSLECQEKTQLEKKRERTGKWQRSCKCVYSLFSVDKILVLLKSLKHSVSTQKKSTKLHWTVFIFIFIAALSALKMSFIVQLICSFYLHRPCQNPTSLQFFRPSRALRICQRLLPGWGPWRRWWSTLSRRDGKWTWRSCTNRRGTCWGNPSSLIKKPKVERILCYEVKAAFDLFLTARSLSFRRSRSQRAEGGRPAVQLHTAQLLRVAAWRAGEDGRHLLAQLPPGEALRRKLRLLLAPLLRLSVCSRQGHQEVPRGKWAVSKSEHLLQHVLYSLQHPKLSLKESLMIWNLGETS